jgi:uncharacterized protein with NAD-binding domain and iron-sulfur cluster
MPYLPSPLGTFIYPQFQRLPLVDRLSALPLLYALIDFDNSDEAWKRYDAITARELFKQYGVSARLYRESFEPMLLVGLFAPGEQCSAAAALGMLYYFILAHQPDFDVRWCRGTVGEQIFRPWVSAIEKAGGKLLANHRVTDVSGDQAAPVTAVVCGDEVFPADAVIFAVGITGMKKIVAASPPCASAQNFATSATSAASMCWPPASGSTAKLPSTSFQCLFGFQPTTGWTFFDLNALHDEYRDAPGSVIEVDYYHANQFLPLAMKKCCPSLKKTWRPAFRQCARPTLIDASVIRLPQAVSHFAPGSYRYLLPTTTSLANVFMSGDWIVNRHGSWSQEKAYVTGLEAANQVIKRLRPWSTSCPDFAYCGRRTPYSSKLCLNFGYPEPFLKGWLGLTPHP